jgi:hypothetical protein
MDWFDQVAGHLDGGHISHASTLPVAGRKTDSLALVRVTRRIASGSTWMTW